MSQRHDGDDDTGRGIGSRSGWPARLGRVAACLTLALGGCASPVLLPAIDPGASVVVDVAVAEEEAGGADIRNMSFGSDVAKGSVAGGVAGGLYGFACGPFWFLCVPVGAAVGSVPGAAAGAVVGASGALTPEKAAQLRARLTQWRQSHDLGAQLQKDLAERARGHWRPGSDAPPFTIRVVLQEIALTSTRDEQIGLVATLGVRVIAPQGAQPAAEKRYEYVGSPGSLLAWLDERNDFVDTTFASFTRQIAAQVVAELARR